MPVGLKMKKQEVNNQIKLKNTSKQNKCELDIDFSANSPSFGNKA